MYVYAARCSTLDKGDGDRRRRMMLVVGWFMSDAPLVTGKSVNGSQRSRVPRIQDVLARINRSPMKAGN